MEKYAVIERERKFTMSADQIDINGLARKLITDDYVLNTSIRFRLVTDEKGTTYKMTKKVPLNIPGETQITTIYLSAQEYRLLDVFGSIRVEKARYLMPFNNLVIALDKYISPTDELWIAEVEFSTSEEMKGFKMPLPFLEEVTAVGRFNGYELAKRFQ